jgi:hypothetical protein
MRKSSTAENLGVIHDANGAGNGGLFRVYLPEIPSSEAEMDLVPRLRDERNSI